MVGPKWLSGQRVQWRVTLEPASAAASASFPAPFAFGGPLAGVPAVETAASGNALPAEMFKFGAAAAAKPDESQKQALPNFSGINGPSGLHPAKTKVGCKGHCCIAFLPARVSADTH